MTLERRLRQHFDAARGEFSEPEPDLQRVVQRGRRRRNVQTSAVAAGTLSLAVVAVLGVQGMTRSRVELAPAAPPPAASDTSPAAPSQAPMPEVTPPSAPTDATQPSPSASSDETQASSPAVDTVNVRRLGKTVLAYGPGHAGVLLIDSSGEDLAWAGQAVAAFPDGRSGFVVQAASQDVVWVPLDGRDVRLDADTDHTAPRTDLRLRTVDPDGSVIFSTRPAKRYGEDDVERFFAVPLDGTAGPQLLAEEGAFESWYEGPAAVPQGGAAQGHVLARCHLLCSLWRWPEDQGPEEPFYDGHTAIEGLTSTPNRTLLAFVESNEVLGDVPELVVLDGVTFKTQLRLALPVKKGTHIGMAAVSLSSDGQRILVSVDAGPTGDGFWVPRTTFLVDDALTAKPVVRKVDFRGVVRWLDPGTVQKK